MHAWESVQETINYIEENLDNDISIEKLAEKAALSPFYYQRLFTRLVKRPVGEYIKLRRLARCAAELENGSRRIIDIAQDYCFSSHANFTRAFKDVYGITPQEFRDTKPMLNHFVKPDLLLNYITVEEGVPLVTDGMTIEINWRTLTAPRTFIGIEGEVPIAELMGGTETSVSTMGKLWDDFHAAKRTIPHLLAGGNEFGALYMGNAKPGFCMYIAAGEAEAGSSAEGFSRFELPATKYLVCGYEAPDFNELTGAAVYKAQTFMDGWMKRHNLVCGAFASEMYYPSPREFPYMENWMTAKQNQ